MNFKLKPKNIIKFSDRQIIEFTDNGEIRVKYELNSNYIFIKKDYILNETFKLSYKSCIVFLNNNPANPKYNLGDSYKIFAEILLKDAVLFTGNNIFKEKMDVRDVHDGKRIFANILFEDAITFELENKKISIHGEIYLNDSYKSRFYLIRITDKTKIKLES